MSSQDPAYLLGAAMGTLQAHAETDPALTRRQGEWDQLLSGDIAPRVVLTRLTGNLARWTGQDAAVMDQIGALLARIDVDGLPTRFTLGGRERYFGGHATAYVAANPKP